MKPFRDYDKRLDIMLGTLCKHHGDLGVAVIIMKVAHINLHPSNSQNPNKYNIFPRFNNKQLDKIWLPEKNGFQP